MFGKGSSKLLVVDCYGDWQRSGLTKVTLIQKYQNCNLITQSMAEPC